MNMPTSDEKNWAIVAHLGTLLVSFVSGGLLQFGVPLVILLVKGDDSRFVAHHARQSLNFQLTLFLAVIPYYAFTVLLVLGLVTIPFALVMACVGPALFFLAEVGFCVLAAMRANAGEPAGYPALPFLSDPS